MNCDVYECSASYTILPEKEFSFLRVHSCSHVYLWHSPFDKINRWQKFIPGTGTAIQKIIKPDFLVTGLVIWMG
jgi:hypothetical protein